MNRIRKFLDKFPSGVNVPPLLTIVKGKWRVIYSSYAYGGYRSLPMYYDSTKEAVRKYKEDPDIDEESVEVMHIEEYNECLRYEESLSKLVRKLDFSKIKDF